MLNDTLSIIWAPPVLAAEVGLRGDGQGHQACRSVKVGYCLDIASETSTDIVLIPFQICGWLFVHVDDGWDHDGLAAVSLLSLLTVIVADPARVPLVWDLLEYTTAGAHSRWNLPNHLLVKDVAVVPKRVVIALAFFKLKLKNHFWEEFLTIQDLPTTQV